MRSNQPPRFATWLLRHFGSGPKNEAILGDLTERFNHSRSRIWYWRQSLLAIVIEFFQEVSQRKLAAVRAVLIGWAVKILWLSVFWRGIWPPDALVRWAWTARGGVFLLVLLAGITSASAGWTVSRFNRGCERAMVLAYLFSELFAWSLVKLILIPKIASPFSVIFAFVGYLTVFAYTWWGSLVIAVGVCVGGGFLSAPPTSHGRSESTQVTT